MTVADSQVLQVGRAEIGRWLPCLDEWLLPDSFYGVQHTWPQLYRSDGQGQFFVLCEGERLLSHCAWRVVTVHGTAGPFRACLLGSVATEPARRGSGLASQVLAAALAAALAPTLAPAVIRAPAPTLASVLVPAPVPSVPALAPARALGARLADHVLLWAERPELYARLGFVASRPETCLQLARGPRRENPGVRLAEIRDHAALHALHERKPLAVERSGPTMSLLLTTPGMTTAVLERDGNLVAYACCGKGADLQGHWHELGGDDEALAELLPAALHLAGQTEAVLLLPPFRASLRERLGRHVQGEFTVAGPMAHSPDHPLPMCWIDGLDSV